MAAQAGQALHVLDRFPITLHLNQAVDQVRRAESSRLRAAGKATVQHVSYVLSFGLFFRLLIYLSSC